MDRVSKINYYLDIAEAVSERGTCLKRRYGAVIVNNDAIISTGYVGAPRGRKNCCDLNSCIRIKLNVPRGTNYDICRSIHAENNAVIQAGRDKCIGGTLYLVGIDIDTGEYTKNANCCTMCKRVIINAGIKEVIIRDSKTQYRIIDVEKEYVENDDSLNIDPSKEGY